MRRSIRAATPGGSCFFTLALQDRSSRLLVDQVAELRRAFADTMAVYPFRIDAMVVLPEHLHAIWTLPPDDADCGKRWMLVKQAFTHRLQASGLHDPASSRARGKGERHLWQRRFWEYQIRDEEDLRRHVDYIHFNPVKHGWVMRAREWPYSSLHRYVRQGLLPADWGISASIDGVFGE